MIIFIVGGVKGGKSMFAQCVAKNLGEHSSLKYLATMMPMDSEDEKRIKRHIFDRAGWGFDTIEEPLDFKKIDKNVISNSTILLDSVTAYVQNNIFYNTDTYNKINVKQLFDDIKYLVDNCENLIIVSDYIFSDALLYADLTDYFKEILGSMHCLIAKSSDVVLECSFSNMRILKNQYEYDFKDIMSEYFKIDGHLQYQDI